jgi:hypothetical protein
LRNRVQPAAEALAGHRAGETRDVLDYSPEHVLAYVFGIVRSQVGDSAPAIDFRLVQVDQSLPGRVIGGLLGGLFCVLLAVPLGGLVGRVLGRLTGLLQREQQR